MKILMQLFRFLARLVLIFLIQLLAAFVEFILLPIFRAILRLMLALFSLTFTATVNGPGQFRDRLAADWTRRLVDIMGSRENMDQIYSFCRLAVGTIILLGWIVAGIFTVIILRVVFGFFI